MFIVALTGDVGAGKSTLSRIWRGMGANVINSDEVAKRQWNTPEAMLRASDRWGPDVARNGSPDYAEIARRAFSGREEYDFACGLIHPGTKAEIARMASSLRGWIVIEIPLYFECGGLDWIDLVVYVTAPEDERVRRNAKRGWDDLEIERRQGFLLSSREKIEMSDIAMHNDRDVSSWEDSGREMGELFRRISAVCQVTTYCSSMENAEEIASALLENRFAACVNISEAESRYVWRGGRHAEHEWRLVCRTTEENVRRAIKCIRGLHPYELPAITAVELSHSDFETLKWIAESCAQ